MTLAKGLRSQNGKDVRLHFSLGSFTSSKSTSHNFAAAFIVFKKLTTTRKVRFGTAVRNPS